MTNTSKKPTPNARELIAGRQRRQKELPSAPAGKKPAGKELKIVAGKGPAAMAADDNYRDRYLNEIAPSGIVGRRIKFSKDGDFVIDGGDEKVPETTTFAALCDQTLIGFVKFNGEGVPPDQKMGLLYQGFVMPQVASLPDRDQRQWELGMGGEPEDPWGHWIYLPVQNVDTLEVDTFVTSSKTGRSGVGMLLKHYERMRKDHAGEVPLVQLRRGGFQHKDSRVGWVNKPMFIIVGSRAADSVAKPDTSTAGILDDEIPDLDKE